MRRQRTLGNRQAPEESRPVRFDDGSSGFYDAMSGGAFGAGKTVFPFSYDASANNGNGKYTWNNTSFGNQTFNAIDASKQFPTGGFLTDPADAATQSPGSGIVQTVQTAPGTQGTTQQPSTAPIVIPTWVPVAAAAALLLLLTGKRGQR